MSNNDYVAPVNHGVLSSTGSVVLGAAGGAAKSIGKMALWTIGIGMVVGVLAFTGPLGAMIASVSSSVGTGSILLGALKVAGGLLVGGGAGALVTTVFSPLVGLVGAGNGATKAHERVSQERGAAHALEAQVAAYQYQAMAQANDNNKYNFAAQGSPMNPAGTTISAMQADGRVEGQQLQRA
ncbi:MAG: hypothetical protein SFW64_01805 [Alphaproteobacteria bacterium]|nr:hypothetical protein [Alphaproteobacteria bacterium]